VQKRTQLQDTFAEKLNSQPIGNRVQSKAYDGVGSDRIGTNKTPRNGANIRGEVKPITAACDV